MPDPAVLQKAVPSVRQGVSDRERALLQGAMVKLRPAQQPVFDTSPQRLSKMYRATEATGQREAEERRRQVNGFQALRYIQDQNDQAMRQIAEREAELRVAASRPKVDVAKLEGVKNRGASVSPWEAFKAASR